MPKPVAVLISDIHYNINTLPLANAALRMAVDKANEFQIPLIVAGDLHDTKANMRAECVDAMLLTFKKLRSRASYVLRGNHDAYNEKSELHALSFLGKVACVFDYATQINLGEGLEPHFIPYHHDVEELRAYLKTISPGSLVIMHQGIEGSQSGDYIQDKSAITHEDVKDFRVISGHYHTRQTIKTGRPQKGGVGLFDYIGNPFTLGFGEANDPLKGFQILMEDGTLEFVPTNLRKHMIINITYNNGAGMYTYSNEIEEHDLIWVKVQAPKEILTKWNRSRVLQELGIKDFRLDLIPTDAKSSTDARLNLSQGPLLDSIIDSLSDTSDERKTRLKSTWKGLI